MSATALMLGAASIAASVRMEAESAAGKNILAIICGACLGAALLKVCL